MKYSYDTINFSALFSKIIGVVAIISLITRQVKQYEFVGFEKSMKYGRTQDSLLWRRFRQMEKLPPKRKQIVQFLYAFLGSEKAMKVGYDRFPTSRRRAR